MRREKDAFIVDIAHGCKTKNLIPTAVREHRAIPPHKGVQPPEGP
jgi:hypothetical protein